MSQRHTAARRTLAVAALAAAITATPLLSTPAHAAGAVSCTIGVGTYGCSIGLVTPNSRNQVRVTAATQYLPKAITCRAVDARNGTEVGRVTASGLFSSSSRTIGGLYGVYLLSCTTTPNAYGTGTISGN